MASACFCVVALTLEKIWPALGVDFERRKKRETWCRNILLFGVRREVVC